MGEEHLGQHLLWVPCVSAFASMWEPPALRYLFRAVGVLQPRPPSPLLQTPEAAIAKEGRVKSKWARSWCDLCPDTGGEEVGGVDHDTIYKLSLYRWALCVPKTCRLCGALQGPGPGKGQTGGWELCPFWAGLTAELGG